MLSGPAASLTATVAANKEQWHETITEFAIANAEWFMMGPGKRALMLIAQMVMTVDAANKAAIVRGSAAPVSEAQQQAVEDL
jgi:malonyl CoA-acyl carrier protein transacylase